MQITVVNGLSGAGRSVAAGALEDHGWFVIDNLPASLVPKVAELATSATGGFERVALVMAGYDVEMANQIEALREQLSNVTVVFLEASDEVLIRRYESTKRRHPLDDGHGVPAAIVQERERLMEARGAADLIIDTSDLNPHRLRERLIEHFGNTEDVGAMRITVSSFGFKHGIPLDVDMVMDCRFLPNPHWDPDLRPYSGLDPQIQEYVLERPDTETFLDHLDALLDGLLPAYSEEGKSYLGLAFGCTGGRHRAVAVAEEVARRLKDKGWKPRVSHRDIDR